MAFHIDHVVLLVSDLDTAVADYQAQGFTVTPGGEHTDGATHNALICFADGSYIELIAFLREAPEHRWWPHVARGPGLIDWALRPDDIEHGIIDASEHGVSYSGPTDGGRVRPDGQELRWQIGLPPTPDLPFLCADVTPRRLRVPEGAAQIHANGITTMAEVEVAVPNLLLSADRFAALLGQAYSMSLHECSFELEPTTVLLRTVADPEDVGIMAISLGGGTKRLRVV